MSWQNPQRQNDDESIKNKFKQSFESMKRNENVQKAYQYAFSNTKDTIAYLLLALGLLLMSLDRMGSGGVIIGVLFGIYFGGDILFYIRNYRNVIEKQGMVRSIVLGGTMLSLLITAPLVFIGCLIAVGIRIFLQ